MKIYCPLCRVDVEVVDVAAPSSRFERLQIADHDVVVHATLRDDYRPERPASYTYRCPTSGGEVSESANPLDPLLQPKATP